MIEWIKASDRLPPVGVPVLVRHRYRLEEYVSYAIGVRLHVTDDEDSPVYWTWTGVKLKPDVYYVNKKPRTSMLVHSLTAGDNQITHWAEITEPVHGMTQEERQDDEKGIGHQDIRRPGDHRGHRGGAGAHADGERGEGAA